MKFRAAKQDELGLIVELLSDDELGSKRESTQDLNPYQTAFKNIQTDQNQHLMVVEKQGDLVGTCQLSIIHSISYRGATRLNIESVRVKRSARNLGIGQWMMAQICEFAKQHECTILQLASNIQRPEAIAFYKRAGFIDSHVGMKKYI